MRVALHYSPVDTNNKQVYGLQIAIRDIVRAWFRYSKQETIPVLISNKAAQEEVKKLAHEAGVDADRIVLLDARLPQINLRGLDVVFRADPDPCHLLWQRQSNVGADFAFMGLVHALSGMDAGATIKQYLDEPSFSGDSLICPSRAVAEVVEKLWQHQAEYASARVTQLCGKNVKIPMPSVKRAIIPLGIDIERMQQRVSGELRSQQRKILGIDEDEIIVLGIGRLSAAIKAHPLATFRSVEAAARRSGRRVRLVLQGYFIPPEAEQSFRRLASATAPSVRTIFVSSDDERFPQGLWASGDIFISLVDNIQESFGLTPIEAMAAGLPRVISDWDGYRDSVTDGIDGFLVPTFLPPAGMGGDLAAIATRDASYGDVLARTALCTIVDEQKAADALVALINSAELRRSIADAAKQRLSNYAWETIISRYHDLWHESIQRRRDSGKNSMLNWSGEHNCILDPFSLYRGYASAALSPSTIIKIADPAPDVAVLLSESINTIGCDILLPQTSWLDIIDLISRHHDGVSASYIISAFPSFSESIMWRTLAWWLKMGILAKG